MITISEVGGTLMSADGGTVLCHVNDVRVSDGTFACQPDMQVDRGTAYALGVGGYTLVVEIEKVWGDWRQPHATGRVIRQIEPGRA